MAMSEQPQPVAGAAASTTKARTSFGILGAISLSHLLNDMIQSLILAIYPLLQSEFSLTFMQIGMITLTFQLASSLLQPVVGYWTDKYPMPWSLPIGMCFTLSGLVLLAISYKNVLKVQPFGNVVVYADMTGKEVIDYLTAVAQMKPDSGAYPQFANVSFVAKDGKLNDLKIKGEPVDPAKTYRMATLNFNATGGDGYPRLDNKPGYVNTGFIDAEVLKAYIQKSSPLDVSVYEPKGEVSWQ